jgi:hypothetical protein
VEAVKRAVANITSSVTSTPSTRMRTSTRPTCGLAWVVTMLASAVNQPPMNAPAENDPTCVARTLTASTVTGGANTVGPLTTRR